MRDVASLEFHTLVRAATHIKIREGTLSWKIWEALAQLHEWVPGDARLQLDPHSCAALEAVIECRRNISDLVERDGCGVVSSGERAGKPNGLKA